MASSLSLMGACADTGSADDQVGTLEQEEAAPEQHADLGKGNGSDVVTIGDSWMSNTLDILEGTGNGIYASLSNSTLRGGQGLKYRNYAVQGVWLLQSSAFGPAIPSQLPAAIRQNPDIKTVIMTGGGNDVIQTAGMQAECKRNSAKCQTLLKNIGTALVKLWDDMGKAGVQDVLYVGYSASAGDSGPNAPTPEGNGVAALCKAMTTVRCHILETTDLVPESGLAIDGIHPTAATNNKIAKAIADKLEEIGARR